MAVFHLGPQNIYICPCKSSPERNQLIKAAKQVDMDHIQYRIKLCGNKKQHTREGNWLFGIIPVKSWLVSLSWSEHSQYNDDLLSVSCSAKDTKSLWKHTRASSFWTRTSSRASPGNFCLLRSSFLQKIVLKSSQTQVSSPGRLSSEISRNTSNRTAPIVQNDAGGSKRVLSFLKVSALCMQTTENSQSVEIKVSVSRVIQ